MSLIAQSRMLPCLLAIAVLVALGCRDSEPAGGGATGPGGDTKRTITLRIGSPAPPLAISEWVTGEPIEEFVPGQVYVVEFWATWCPPCRDSMPHLSALQEEYGDEVKFIGVTTETRDVVEEFLQQEYSDGITWADTVQYRLLTDNQGATNSAYMTAAGQEGIPAAFIVGRDGIVEWIGHPTYIDAPLDRIVAGD